MMKRRINKHLLSIICLAVLTTACTNEEQNLPLPQQPTEGNTTVKAGNITFSINELPFGVDIEEDTRNTQPTIKDTVDLSDGIEAELTLEPDTKSATRASKIGLSDGTYRVFAYKAGVNKGMFTFVVSGGNVISAGQLSLPAGVYSFYCCNEHVAAENNKFTIPHSNVGGALIGFAKDVYVSGENQHITFSMTHAGGRIRTKLMALTPLPVDLRTRLGIATGTQSHDMTYNLITDAYAYAPASPTPLPFPEHYYTRTADEPDAGLGVTFNTSVSNDYTYFVSGTPFREIAMTFLNPSPIYRKAMNSFTAKKLSSGIGNVVVNKSYTLKIRIVPNFRYLFQDGNRGYLRDCGNRLPIALCITDHLAMGLFDAAPWDYPEAYTPSIQNPPTYVQEQANKASWSSTAWKRQVEPKFVKVRDNDVVFTSWQNAISYDTHGGFYWTWIPNGSTGFDWQFGGPGQVITDPAKKIKGKNFNRLYPAFYWAGNRYPDAMIRKCQSLGLPYNATFLAIENKWFLPSAYEWYWLHLNIGFGQNFTIANPADPSTYDRFAVANYSSQIVNYALVKAGGMPLWYSNGEGHHYYTSSEYINSVFQQSEPNFVSQVFCFTANSNNKMYITADLKDPLAEFTYPRYRVRAFVNY